MKSSLTDWKETKLGEICELLYGKSLPKRSRIPGNVPVYGSNGPVGTHNEHLISGPAIIIGRKGSIGEIHLVKDECWPIDTTYYIDSSVTKCDLMWLAFYLKSLNLSNLNKAAAVPGLNRNDVYNLSVSLPPLSGQKRIAAILNDHMADIARAHAAAEEQLEAAEALSAAYLREIFESKEAQKWSWPQLKEIAGINPRRPRDLRRTDETPTTFVPMPSVDGTSGTISNPLEKPFGEVRKGYTYFEKNDVLFAKITPCMQNKKHVIARKLIDGIGFGTTEFHVIRPGDEVIPEWIHLYIRQPSILNAAATHFTGSVGQQRVPSYFLETLAIPLPSLSEQKRIAAILNDRMAGIARACNAVREKLEAINHLPSAILRKAFNGEL